MFRIEFELNGLPPTGNAHRHWRVAGKDRSTWRGRVKLRTFMQRPPSPLTSAKLTCTRYSSTEPDFDNLAFSFKSVVDGLKDAGIIQDDKPSVIKERVYLWEKFPAKAGKIKVVVEEL